MLEIFRFTSLVNYYKIPGALGLQHYNGLECKLVMTVVRYLGVLFDVMRNHVLRLSYRHASISIICVVYVLHVENLVRTIVPDLLLSCFDC